jgi:hypothetical protein
MSTATGFNPIHLDDVASCLNNCSESFAQLAALLHVIKEKAQEDGADAAKLAALGCAVAADMENYADATREQLQKGGVKQ